MMYEIREVSDTLGYLLIWKLDVSWQNVKYWMEVAKAPLWHRVKADIYILNGFDRNRPCFLQNDSGELKQSMC